MHKQRPVHNRRRRPELHLQHVGGGAGRGSSSRRPSGVPAQPQHLQTQRACRACEQHERRWRRGQQQQHDVTQHAWGPPARGLRSQEEHQLAARAGLRPVPHKVRPEVRQSQQQVCQITASCCASKGHLCWHCVRSETSKQYKSCQSQRISTRHHQTSTHLA